MTLSTWLLIGLMMVLVNFWFDFRAGYITLDDTIKYISVFFLGPMIICILIPQGISFLLGNKVNKVILRRQ